MKKYALFLGCLIPQRLPCTEIAARKVFEKLGIELVDLQGYTCCPDPIVARLMDRKMSLALSARNLSLAEQHGLDIVVLCNGCFETLFEANRELKHDSKLRDEVNELLSSAGRRYDGRVQVKHVVEVLYEDGGVKMIKKHIERPLKLKLAMHPGCHLFREENGGDIMRKPRMMREIIHATGADVIECKNDRICCGFPMMQADEEWALKNNVLPKLVCYQHAQVDGVVVPCPTCNLQFELGQVMLHKYGERYNIPCLHIVELLALAFGFSAEELALDIHRSPVLQLAQKVI
jgi:heterodisulfide reductase subunit B